MVHQVKLPANVQAQMAAVTVFGVSSVFSMWIGKVDLGMPVGLINSELPTHRTLIWRLASRWLSLSTIRLAPSGESK